MEQEDIGVDQELMDHFECHQFDKQLHYPTMHNWEEFRENSFCDMIGQKDFTICNNETEVRNKGPSPCNSQASLGYHSLPSSQCGSRPSSNPDYIIDYGTLPTYEQPITMYHDSSLVDRTDPSWRHDTSGQSMDMSVRGINYGQNDCASMQICVDTEWRQWRQQKHQNLQQRNSSQTSHTQSYHGNNIQIAHQSRMGTPHASHVGQHQNEQVFRQKTHTHHPGHVDRNRQLAAGCWSSSSNPMSEVRCQVQQEQRYYEEPHLETNILSKSLTSGGCFQTPAPIADPIYEEIVEQQVLSNDTPCIERRCPIPPPRPKSWTSMVNLHQAKKAPVYYQIEQPISHQHHDNCSKIYPDQIKSALPASNAWKPNNRVYANARHSMPVDNFKQDEVNNISLPYLPHIHRLFQDESVCLDNNEASPEKGCKSNEKKSGKRFEKFFGSLLNLNKNKAVKNIGTSTAEKVKDDIAVDKHRKLRRTVSESCNIYSKSKGNAPTYEDDMCNLLKEIKTNMKEIDHNSKKLQRTESIAKGKKTRGSEGRPSKPEDRKISRNDKRKDMRSENCEVRYERLHSAVRHQSITQSTQHEPSIGHSSRDIQQSGASHRINHHAVNVKNARARNVMAERSCNKSPCRQSRSKSRPAMGVQALLTRNSHDGDINKTVMCNENSVGVDSFARRLSHERPQSQLSFVYDYSEASDSDNSEMAGSAGYPSEDYSQCLASGEDNQNWKEDEQDQVYGLSLAKPLFRNNVVATARRRKLIEKVTEL